jgi:hypothetical protein
MLFCKSPFFDWLKESLAAVAKMALTNYLMHSVICMFEWFLAYLVNWTTSNYSVCGLLDLDFPVDPKSNLASVFSLWSFRVDLEKSQLSKNASYSKRIGPAYINCVPVKIQGFG